MKKDVHITAEGKKDLEKELAELIAKRPEIAEKIATARAFGDLSENEEYSSARAEQKMVENRILEIQDILKNAKVIKAGKRSSVSLGVNVKLDLGGRKMEYTVVGATEADPTKGKISNESPIGKVIMGHKEGETLEFNGKKVKIISIN
ncbi:MAG: transcription elongation factor GreA [Candidatus Saccharibacteria bacterium]|nr:transcription elongation factor GreA [Candidatus Saccharibacteria bacterium]